VNALRCRRGGEQGLSCFSVVGRDRAEVASKWLQIALKLHTAKHANSCLYGNNDTYYKT
jgi:hypothetical protein